MFVVYGGRTMANAKQIVPDTGIDLRRGRRRESLAAMSRRWIEQQKQKAEEEERRRQAKAANRAKQEEERRARQAAAVGKLIGDIPTSAACIIEQVAFWAGVTIEDIMGKSRDRRIKDIRWDAMIAVYDNCRLNGERYGLVQIGRVFGVDHTTALNCFRKRGVMRPAQVVEKPRVVSEEEPSGFRCPSCDSKKIKIICSRPASLGRRRRRVCLSCDHRFSTIEQVVPDKKRKGDK